MKTFCQSQGFSYKRNFTAFFFSLFFNCTFIGPRVVPLTKLECIFLFCLFLTTFLSVQRMFSLAELECVSLLFCLPGITLYTFKHLSSNSITVRVQTYFHHTVGSLCTPVRVLPCHVEQLEGRCRVTCVPVGEVRQLVYC